VNFIKPHCHGNEWIRDDDPILQHYHEDQTLFGGTKTSENPRNVAIRPWPLQHKDRKKYVTKFRNRFNNESQRSEQLIIADQLLRYRAPPLPVQC
jgi:hypothetical protein